ncbi:MAG: O-antigen ligase family protein [Patescibacteria group bacterium]|nr:O-antigen ligase family protein [Patescibacteria group bacterium]
MNNNLETMDRIAYWWVKISVYAALVMPFIFLPWTVYPYIFGKTVYLMIVLMSALPWYIYLLARKPEYRPRRSLIMYGLAAYFIGLFLAVIFGVDSNRSFWSYHERMTGFWPLLHYLLFYFMAISVFRGWREWKKVLIFNVGVSVALSFVAFIQRVAPELVLQTGARTGAFMNNPIFLAAYLIFTMFITLVLLQKAVRWSTKAMWGAMLAIQFLAFLFAETRGAMVGVFLAGLVYLALYAILKNNKKIRIISAGIFLAIILASAGFWLIKDQAWTAQVPGLNRFRDISLTGGTAATRFIAWEIAWKGFLERPVFGWGPENYFYTFNKYYNPKSLEFSFYETWFDHAHNQMMDMLNNTGVVGTAAYLALFALIIIQLTKAFKGGKIDTHIYCGSIGILIGYFVQNLFIFDQPNALIMFYFCLAWWQSETTEPKKEGRLFINTPAVAGAWLAVLIIFSFAVLYLFTFRTAFASTWVRSGVIASQAGDYKGSAAAFEKGMAISNQYPDLVPLYYSREMAQISRSMQMPSDELAEYLERSYDALKATVPLHPMNIYNYYLMSLIQLELGKIDPTHHEQALADIDEALRYSPDRQQLRFVRGKALLNLGRTDEAVQYYLETVNLDPNVTESWWNLGIAYYEAEWEDKALEAFEKSASIGGHPVNLPEVAAMVELNAKAGNMPRVIELYNFAIDNIDENDPRLYAGIAAAYFEVGEYELARLYANIAKQLDPSISADTDEFLKMIDEKEAKAGQ